MMDGLIYACILMLTAAIVLALARIARGPTVLDRILAFDLIATCAVGIIVLLSMKWHTADYLELILIYTLLGFSGTVAFAFYLQRRGVDPNEGDDASGPPGPAS